MTQGISDVALARCIQVQAALKADDAAAAAYAKNEGPAVEFILMIDDDMVFTPQIAEAVLQEAHEAGRAVSARYMVGDVMRPKMACSNMGNGRYLTGLGFLAVPIEQMRERVARAEMVKWGDKLIPAITASGPAGPQWVSEDYEFTVGLGGVLLSKHEVGHVKPVTLVPSQFKLEPPPPPQIVSTANHTSHVVTPMIGAAEVRRLDPGSQATEEDRSPPGGHLSSVTDS